MELSRREVLAGLGVTGATALSGCGSNVQAAQGEASDKEVPPPDVREPDGWVVASKDTQPRVFKKGKEFGLEYTAVGHTRQYENKQLRKRVREETFGNFDRPLLVASASRIDFFPDYAHVGTSFKTSEIEQAVKSKLKSRMAEAGIQNVRYDEKHIWTNGPGTHYFTFKGHYQVPEFKVEDVEIPHSPKESFTFESEHLPIKGIAAYHKDGTHLVAGGGVFPNGPYEKHKEVELSGGVKLEVNVDLELRPDRYESEVLDFIGNISA